MRQRRCEDARTFFRRISQRLQIYCRDQLIISSYLPRVEKNMTGETKA